MKRFTLFFTALVLTLALTKSDFKNQQPTHAPVSAKEAQVAVSKFISQHVYRSVMAAESVGDASCETDFQSKVGGTQVPYQHGALSHFANMFFLLNVQFPAGPENALCHFARSMGMDPDLTALPIEISQTFGTVTVDLTVAAPTETWATAAGYEAKGTVTVDDTTYMVIYWGGENSSSKGFMIEGPEGLSGDDDASRATYALWDRTNAEAQTIKIFAAKWGATGLFAGLQGNDDSTGTIWGEATYNSTTKAMTADVITLEEREGTNPNAFKCFKLAGSGVKDGQMSVAKETNPLDVTDANTDDTGMEGVSLPDSADTENICQDNNAITDCNSLTAQELIDLVDQQYSCNDVYTAGDTGGVFEGNTVDFDTCPAEVFEGGSC